MTISRAEMIDAAKRGALGRIARLAGYAMSTEQMRAEVRETAATYARVCEAIDDLFPAAPELPPCMACGAKQGTPHKYNCWRVAELTVESLKSYRGEPERDE